MCQQYMDRFPEEYSELEEYFYPQYMYLSIEKCLWQWNVLSEVAMSFYVHSMLRQQRDELTISHGLIPLLRSLPTTVYMPALVMSEASDFSESIWIQSSHDFNQSVFMKILVDGARAREEKSHPKDALYHVLVKAIKNPRSTGMKVELIMDVLLSQQAQPLHYDLWDPPDCRISGSGSAALFLIAARRGPEFINVAFKLLECLEKNFNHCHKESSPRVIRLIRDEASDDYTVANIISKLIEYKTITFGDSEKVDFARFCSSYTGSGSRTLTATMLWKSYAHLLNFPDVLSAAKNEDVPFAILEEFNIYLYSSESKAENGSNSLHVAAEKGFTKFVELALDRGFAKLLEYSNEKDQLPVHVALECKHYDTAAVMLRAMNDYKLCLATDHSAYGDTTSQVSNTVKRVNFRELLDRLKDYREGKQLVRLKKETKQLVRPKKERELLKKEEDSDGDQDAGGSPERGEDHQTSRGFDSKHTVEDLQDCVMAILDSTVDRDGCVNHHEVLEADYKGNTPDKENFNCPSMHSIEFIIRHKEYFKDIIEHESFQSLVKRKWKLYGRNLFMILFVVYLVCLVFFTTALVLGATKAGSPSDYSQPIDWFRLFCEIVVLLVIIIDVLLKINQLCYSGCKVYFTDRTNWFEILAISLILLIIPFRIANLDVQWVFVALAYISNTLRVFKYAVINSSFVVYVTTLSRIIRKDIGPFLAVFIVITISFGGGLYFSLRADTCRLPADRMTTDGEVQFSPVTNTSLCLHPDETSEIYLSWLTGFRLLIEGNVIDSYIFGDRGFWWFSVMIYIVFLFLVAVIMLNLLIAQFNSSYEDLTKKVRKSVTPDRAKILVDQQSTAWIRHCCDALTLNKEKRGRKNFMSASKFYQPYSAYKKSDDEETTNDFDVIRKQLLSSTSTDQKQFKELQSQLKNVKEIIANSAKEQVTTLSAEMNKQAAEIKTVKSGMASQSKVVKELQSEVRTLVTALHEQIETAVEQQRQIKESLKSLGEVKDILLQK